MSSQPPHALPPVATLAFIALISGCGPAHVFDADGPFLEKTYLPPLVSFHQSEGRWPSTKDELRSFCDRQGIDMNPGFWNHVQMAPADDALVVLWHKGDDYATQRWRWVNGQPKSEAIDFEEARRVLKHASRTNELDPASRTRQ